MELFTLISGSFLETKMVYSDNFNQLTAMADPC